MIEQNANLPPLTRDRSAERQERLAPGWWLLPAVGLGAALWVGILRLVIALF